MALLLSGGQANIFGLQWQSPFVQLVVDLHTDLHNLISDLTLLYDAYINTLEFDAEVTRDLCRQSHALRIFEDEFSRRVPTKAAIANALEKNQPLPTRLTPTEQHAYYAKTYDDGVRVVNSQAIGVERLLMQIEADYGRLQSEGGGPIPLVFIGPGGVFRAQGKRKPVFRPEPDSFRFRDRDANDFLKAVDYFQDPKALEAELNQPIEPCRQSSRARNEATEVGRNYASSIARNDQMDVGHVEQSNSDSERTVISSISDWQPTPTRQSTSAAMMSSIFTPPAPKTSIFNRADSNSCPSRTAGPVAARPLHTDFINVPCAASPPPPPADTNKTCTRTNKIRPIEAFDLKKDGTAYATCRHCQAYMIERARKARTGR